ncbi:DEAD/DEAH box helicase [Thalassoglobus polymorphus]|uniref:DEAD-box ATP-dependent RNA helicase CshA n=1 Tax=Thalassoglobus polymorphus TaxID=2527994 RepID=A0A517QKC0_9PLAN|nr:DEAD/DEAH box helicase [Thalassoglobus polymorphus]QDT32083.1 DEAD-box ATP-dependent RNA helicase CshA [Thalassoglobus polymorphus]
MKSAFQTPIAKDMTGASLKIDSTSAKHLMAATETLPTFESLNLNSELLDTIKSLGFTAPTPIQKELIPVALTGVDCIGQARTGTGKTAAFALPILQNLNRKSQHIQALVLAPTRELSEQVAQEFRYLAGGSPCEVVLTVGGRPLGPQIKSLERYPQVVIGTPGRVIDLIQRKVLKLDHISTMVLDEADRMLDIGFRKDIERILRSCNDDRQTLLLSATLPDQVQQLANRFMREPRRIDLSDDHVVVDTIEQFYCTVERKNKFQLLIKLLIQERPSQAIVFCRTKRSAHEIYTKIQKYLSDVEAIHGDLQQRKRDQVIRRLRDGRARLVIATDIVGRGIDISGISHIINYDIPEGSDDYIHRVGRTGRMSSDSDGRAFTFVTPEQGGELTKIEMRINQLLQEYQFEGYDAFSAREIRTVPENEAFVPTPASEQEWDSIFDELS